HIHEMEASPTVMRIGITFVLCMLALMAAASCGRESKLPTTAPTPEAAKSRDGWDRALATRASVAQEGFYPLELGNRWHYVYTYTTEFRSGDGSPPEPPIVESTTTELRLVC